MDKVIEYLEIYKTQISKHYSDINWLEPRYKFFNLFFEIDNLEKLNWEDIQKLGENLHAFQSMAIAKGNALGRPNAPIENYRKNLIYLKYSEDPINEKIDNLLKGAYNIPYFGTSVITELIGYAYSEDYVFYNKRDKDALAFLGIKPEYLRGDSDGIVFLKYNIALEPLKVKYKQIIGKFTSTSIPLEIDQFFSWIYKNYVNSEHERETALNLNYYNKLKQFIEQSQTTNQKYKHFSENIAGLRVSAKFGIGALLNVPWISFLGGNNSTQQGIYPVYLYYKKHNLLILAYGVSENSTTKQKWPLNNLTSISEYFREHNYGKPENYGDSFIYKVYKVPLDVNADIINEDLSKLLTFYNSILNKDMTNDLQSKNEFDYKHFQKVLLDSNLFYSENICLRMISSFLTKPFIILTGLSGSGKTKLAQSFAQWISENENQYCIIPVGSDWTNRDPLLGFTNALEDSKYLKPDNGALDLILEASKEENQSKPYFLILDEMNLSHVERYFADFLSVMETKENIFLHSGDVDWNGVPSELSLPKNLFIVGTVNIDETTYMFSPKVLDRANVIEFRVSKKEMEHYLENNLTVNLQLLKGLGKEMASDFIRIASDNSFKPNDIKSLNYILNEFFDGLKKTGAEFGYRTASEIHRFIAVVNKIAPGVSMPNVIDAAIMQKLLPKIHGSRKKLDKSLKILGKLCLQDSGEIDNFINDYLKSEVDFSDESKIKYPLSLEKILRMYQGLIDNGFTSYAEA